MNHRIVENPRLRDRAPVFRDRLHAGDTLAALLRPLVRDDALVLAIPSGGVPVAARVAGILGLPLDVLVASKITPPWNTETACGAVASDGTVLVEPELVRGLGMDSGILDEATRRAVEKVRRRVRLLRGDRPEPDLAGRQVVLVDDGLATGATMKAAVRMVRAHQPDEIIVAVPTGHLQSVFDIAGEADRVVCPNIRSGISFAVAAAYEDWYDVPETEAAAMLRAAWDRETERRSDRA